MKDDSWTDQIHMNNAICNNSEAYSTTRSYLWIWHTFQRSMVIVPSNYVNTLKLVKDNSYTDQICALQLRGSKYCAHCVFIVLHIIKLKDYLIWITTKCECVSGPLKADSTSYKMHLMRESHSLITLLQSKFTLQSVTRSPSMWTSPLKILASELVTVVMSYKDGWQIHHTKMGDLHHAKMGDIHYTKMGDRLFCSDMSLLQ